jgi:hypothetical protein
MEIGVLVLQFITYENKSKIKSKSKSGDQFEKTEFGTNLSELLKRSKNVIERKYLLSVDHFLR